MKRIKTIILLAVLSVISALNANAQVFGPEWYEVWCTIDVDIASDPREGVYASYPFPHPPEYIGLVTYNNGYPMIGENTSCACVGPGRPYITNEDGGDPILHLDLKNLEIEATVMSEDQPYNIGFVEVFINFPVHKETNVMEIQQYYYSIRLVVVLRDQ